MPRYFLPKGYKVSGIHCGIKKFNKDLGLIYSEAPCKAVGVFTKNKVKAAPVILSKEVLSKGEPIHAIIINSGNANCCTGRVGMSDAKRMAQAVAENLNIGPNNVCVSSTGIIGHRMPIDTIRHAVPHLVKHLNTKAIMSLSKAILTTDKKRKMETIKFVSGGKDVVITAVCKGSGMIHPNMATMLCFIMSDANIDKDALRLALKHSVDRSFNKISIDNDMSTNDSVYLLANGAAGNDAIKKGTKEFDVFQKALDKVCMALAQDIVRDGEGATKLITIEVKGAKKEADAEMVARIIANSCLVKTSVHGQDPNWGRVAASVGSSLVEGISQNKVEIYLDKVCMFKKGGFTNPAANKVSKIYRKANVSIVVNLNSGNKSAKMFTCDLSKRYIDINAHYST